MINQLDLNLKLLRGKLIPIYRVINKNNIEVCKVHPITLDEIERMTLDKYHRYMSLFTIDDKTVKEIMNINEDITAFEFVYINCRKDEEYKSLIFEAIEFFLKEKVEICGSGFYLGSIDEYRIIDEEIYKKIANIIKLQNCLVDKKEEEKYKPANERARQMLEQMKKNQEELDKAKAKDGLNLCDLISIFAAYSENMNILNVWDLTFYQFNDQFNRLKIMKEYDANLQILMHCDTSKNKIDLKHWLSPS